MLDRRLAGKTPSECRSDLPAELGVILFQDNRHKHLIRVAAWVAGEQGQHVTGDAVLNFVERAKSMRMP